MTELEVPIKPKLYSRNRVLLLATILIISTVLITIYRRKLSKMPSITEEQKPIVIEIHEDSFSPEYLQVNKGTTVKFINKTEELHSVASDPYPENDKLPDFNSTENIPPNKSFSYTFEKVGTWSYHDNLNPFDLQATIEVK